MASDNNLEISRRKILAGMGAMGAAGAVAGLGTSALFNDTESFEENQLTAGELDLKMDWEEHYSFPQIYEGSDPDAPPAELDDPTIAPNGDSLDILRTDPESVGGATPADYVALPDPENPIVWANDTDSQGDNDESSLEIYFSQTVIEAFPDTDDTDPGNTYVGIENGEATIGTPCNTLADVPEPGLKTYNEAPEGGTQGTDYFVSDLARSVNDDTWDSDNNTYLPLINLTDVKPGDFGEFTFSAHLCDNPGHLWLQMPDGLTESENGLTDPEQDPALGDDQTSDEGELADNIQTALWYDDNCNNRIDGEPEDLVALAIVDNSGSGSPVLGDVRTAANELINQLESAQSPNLRIFAGIVVFNDDGDKNDVVLSEPIQNISQLASGSPPVDSTNIPNTTGNSPIPQALDVGREYLNDVATALDNDSNINLSNPNKQLLLVSDGNPVYSTSGTDDEVFGDLLDGTGGYSSGSFSPLGDFTDSVSNNNVSVGPYTSDYFDGKPDNNLIQLPDPDGGELNGTDRAETALVARDVDGEPFLTPSATAFQPAGPKDDGPAQSGDAIPISGDDGVTVRTVAAYQSGNSSADTITDTMMAYATSSGAYYDLQIAGPTSLVNTLVTDLNVKTGENVIFRGSLSDLATRLDPSQNGPIKLEGELPNGCFAPGAEHCFGLAWSVPTSVGNEIQSDSASFELGFYTEECRNNPTPDGP
jgi:predicted ribosomally synthesized peptide with SipW-like signal peptide